MATVDRDRVQLSKRVSHALRHAPWIYELELDEEGWAPVPDLLEALRGQRPAWRGLTEGDLAELVARSDKRRFELHDGRIRALYGHSLPERLRKVPAAPPPTLFHGTSRRSVAAIRAGGLRPMRRQYVHLSADRETARQVAARKPPPPVILEIAARAAHGAGVRFYAGNELVWLADSIPPEFITIPEPA